LSDVFIRFPRLKLVLSEGGVGWIPYVLGQIDYVWERHGGWTHTAHAEPPSTLFREHVFGCFIDDRFGASQVRTIGVENCMIETDYPHSDTSWPNTQTLIAERLAYLDDDERALVMRGNAERVFQFQAADLHAGV
jgi:predicted TIM-barrel fold metal-dependent hydrolase